MADYSYSSSELIERFGIDERLEQYFDLLTEWNSKINLVSRETGRDDWRRLAAESIAPLAVLEDAPELEKLRGPWKHHLDIGSGGGFPAVPLCMTDPVEHSICIDSVGKKAKALSDMIVRLGLDAESDQIRLEEWKTDSRFDLVSMRLVSLDIRLWKRIHRLIETPGLFIYYSQPKFIFKPSGFHVKQCGFRVDNSDVVKQLTYVFR